MKFILAIYANKRGFGYAYMKLPDRVFDSGIASIRPISNDLVLKRVERMIEFLKPSLVVVRSRDERNQKDNRLRKLVDSIHKLTIIKGIPMKEYSRQEMRDTFEILFGARTKYEIAKKIIECLPVLADREPKLRKLWMDEDYNMGMFDAFALIFTHEYLKK